MVVSQHALQVVSQHALQQVSRRGVCSRGVPAPGAGLFPGAGVWRPPQKQTAPVADGTHPTGMHSCFICLFERLLPPANEVWSKVIFLQASVILFTGWLCHPPPLVVGRPPPLCRNPSPMQTPMDADHSPPKDKRDTTGYGQQAGGTHPTGMLSCFD